MGVDIGTMMSLSTELGPLVAFVMISNTRALRDKRISSSLQVVRWRKCKPRTMTQIAARRCVQACCNSRYALRFAHRVVFCSVQLEDLDAAPTETSFGSEDAKAMRKRRTRGRGRGDQSSEQGVEMAPMSRSSRGRGRRGRLVDEDESD